MEGQRDRFNRTYKVIDRLTNQEVEGAFILFPARDLAARKAMETYAASTPKEKIVRWIKAWLREINRIRNEQRERNLSERNYNR